jgi:hypothetical protein
MNFSSSHIAWIKLYTWQTASSYGTPTHNKIFICLTAKSICLMKYKTNTVYASVVFITFTAFSVSNTHMIMTYSIISLLNISFVKKRCRKMTISTNKGCKVGMTLFGDVVYCQTFNVTQNCTKMLHYTAGLSSCLVKRSTYISHRVFCIEYKQYITIISMAMAYKKNKSCLPMHDATFV